jgi:hypothetical protein
MSTRESDYSNTIIYKITCKDPNISDVYVGHTVNFVQRKHAHRISCINSSSLGYNCKVYRVIRNNGGWDNWDMRIIAFYNCKDLHEARQKEQEHFIELNATLNSIEPFPLRLPKTITPNKDHAHNVPIQTLNIPVGLPPSVNKSVNKSGVYYNCEPCGFSTDNKTDYERHLTRRKHYNNVIYNEKSLPKPEINVCSSCNKIFKHRTSVYKHKLICPGPPPPPPPPPPPQHVITHNAATIPAASSATATIPSNQYLLDMITKNQELTSTMMILIQQNTEFQSKMMELFINNTGTSQRHTRDNET